MIISFLKHVWLDAFETSDPLLIILLHFKIQPACFTSVVKRHWKGLRILICGLECGHHMLFVAEDLFVQQNILY